MTSARVAPAGILRPDGVTMGKRTLAVETPVAVEVDGLGYAVMMMTPADLEAFAVGFMLTERLVDGPSDVAEVEAFGAAMGTILRITLAERCRGRIVDRVRHRTSDTGCGLCGIAGLEQLRRPVPTRPPAPLAAPAALFAALASLRGHQPLNAATGAVHAAAACDRDGRVLAAYEDVGRHNALDKLIGGLASFSCIHPRAGGGSGAQVAVAQGSALDIERTAPGPRPSPGKMEGVGVARRPDFLLVTSRLSFEMVDKALVAGAPMLVGVSAATTLALDHAREHGLTLVALARADAVLVLHDPHGRFG